MSSKPKDNSKFSRQIFLQYFTSAIIPVLVLSFLSYLSITELLNKNANRQIYAESRAIGLTLFDRFLNLERNLTFSKNYIGKGDQLKQYPWLKKMFNSIYILEEGVVGELMYGIEPINLDLTLKQKEQIKNRSLLSFREVDGLFESFMVLPIKDDVGRYLVGKINAQYIWDMVIKGNDAFCVLKDKKDLVYCSSHIDSVKSNLLDEINIMKSTEAHNIDINEKEFLSNSWNLFIDSQFGIDSFLIIYFIEKNEALFDYDYYKSVFPQTIFITLLFVYLLSSVQMRRSLAPLSKLTEGVKNIGEGKYDKKINIESHNEFAILGHAFNDMSSQINRQFIKLSTLSKIDRLILSTSNLEYIVQVLIENIPAFISSHNASVLIFDTESRYCGINYYSKAKPNEGVEKINVILSVSEYDELLNSNSILKKNDIGNISYLEPLKISGAEFLIILPLKIKSNLIGAITISVNSELYGPSNSEDLVELADRAAVAISNAQWEKKLFHQAHYDALTKLPNRYLFKDRLEQAIERAKRNNLNVAVLFIDLDRFKSINDSLGHSVGDKLLAEVSTILLKCVRTYDSVARFGGDEYTIVVSDVQPNLIEAKAQQLADRISEMMSEAIIIDQREFFVSPSIGISIYPRDAKNFDDLLKNADTAMYKAKSLVTGNYQFYETMQNKETLARMELENDLRHAAEKGQLELYYQPNINVIDNKIYGVEALIRWNHPDKGMVPPDVFIPIAEETGLITSIGYWVMQKACETNKQWEDQGIVLNMAINISADQFRHMGLYERIMKIIRETGVSAKNIDFEITESITIENFGKTIALLNKFKEAGLGICIDDFGTGYSSMTYLQKIPINKLKIDKSFIDNIASDKDVASITGAIIALAHNLELIVVGEGVESKEQYEYLSNISCNEIQGYYISKPLPDKQVLEFIKDYNGRTE